MKRIFYFLFIFYFSSCSVAKINQTYFGNSYKYKYELVKPAPDTTLTYEDDKMKFDFTIGNKEIDFVAKNKSDQPVRIYWDEASLVMYGTAEKIMHKGIKYNERNSSMPPTTIPSNASIEDLVVPTSKVYYREGYYGTYVSTPGGWETNDLFPTQDLKSDKVKSVINNSKGTDFSLYLPIKTVDGKEFGYSFVFKIRDVSCIDCKIEEVSAAPNKSKVKVKNKK
jgi:hypothetical protein